MVRPGFPAVLLLHGLAGYGGEWNAVIEGLDPSVGVIAPDQRGHGDRFDPDADFDMDRDTLVRDAVAAIEPLADHGVVVVVGQSMGGIVAHLLAHKRPDLVSHLMLIEAGVSPMTEQDFAALGNWLDSWPERFSTEEESVDFFGPDRKSTPAWIAGLARSPEGLRPRFNPRHLLQTMRELATDSRHAEWDELPVPVTLMVGDGGFIGDDEQTAMLAARPDASLIRAADSGHDVHLDQPAVVAESITTILQSLT